MSGVWVKVHPDDAGGGAPGAAVIGGATGAVTESSFTGDASIPGTEPGQAYDVYEFLGSGELVVSEPGFADVLVIGGGGGGGIPGGGGGGAGGVLDAANGYLNDGTVKVVVGAGGSGWNYEGFGRIGLTGSASIVGDLYGLGGGGGGGNGRMGDAYPGGSGGGAGASAGKNGGAGTFGQGNAGGGGAAQNKASGGGGAGEAGHTGSGPHGAGGDGTSSSITGSPVTRGGGGGGGDAAGGAGGGGAGGYTNGTAGTVNTGGGGGGQVDPGTGSSAAGGSGIVIVRVKVASESYPFRTKTTAPKTAHAARIEDGIVRQVIVIPHLDDDDAKITEYCNRIGLPGTWVDTSYTGSRRGKYAGVGDTFVGTKSGGEFVSPVVEEISE
jgi:hypothetical protein